MTIIQYKGLGTMIRIFRGGIIYRCCGCVSGQSGVRALWIVERGMRFRSRQCLQCESTQEEECNTQNCNPEPELRGKLSCMLFLLSN